MAPSIRVRKVAPDRRFLEGRIWRSTCLECGVKCGQYWSFGATLGAGLWHYANECPERQLT